MQGVSPDAQASTGRRHLDTRRLSLALSSAAVGAGALAAAAPAVATPFKYLYCENYFVHNAGCEVPKVTFYRLEGRDENLGSVAVQGDYQGTYYKSEAYNGNVVELEFVYNCFPSISTCIAKAWHSAVKDSKGADLIRAYRWSS